MELATHSPEPASAILVDAEPSAEALERPAVERAPLGFTAPGVGRSALVAQVLLVPATELVAMDPQAMAAAPAPSATTAQPAIFHVQVARPTSAPVTGPAALTESAHAKASTLALIVVLSVQVLQTSAMGTVLAYGALRSPDRAPVPVATLAAHAIRLALVVFRTLATEMENALVMRHADASAMTPLATGQAPLVISVTLSTKAATATSNAFSSPPQLVLSLFSVVVTAHVMISCDATASTIRLLATGRVSTAQNVPLVTGEQTVSVNAPEDRALRAVATAAATTVGTATGCAYAPQTQWKATGLVPTAPTVL